MTTRALLLVCLIVVSIPGFSQAYKDSINAQFMRYTNLIADRKFEKALGFMNPAFFKIVPKETMVKAIEQTFNTPGIEFALESGKILEIQDKKLISGESFAVLRYTNNLKMRFKDDDSGKVDNSAMQGMLEKQFGIGNVQYDSSSRYYEIQSTKKAVANSKDNKKWTFTVIEQNQRALLERFIPKAMLQ